MYGAKADGVTDDTVAINDALNAVPDGGTLFFPDGIYFVSETDSTTNNDRIAAVVEGSGARVSGWMPFTANATCRIKGFSILTTGYVSNFYLIGYKSDGTITTHTYNKTSAVWPCTYDEANDIATFTTPNAPYQYFRISAYYKGNVLPIVTINEEII